MRIKTDLKVIAFTLIITLFIVATVFVLRAQSAESKTPPFYSSVASVFNAAGEPALACRRYSGYIVAHKSLPCGSRVRFCYRGCAWARVGDRGPYIGGRTWDLDTSLAGAIGFPYGVATVKWRRAGDERGAGDSVRAGRRLAGRTLAPSALYLRRLLH